MKCGVIRLAPSMRQYKGRAISSAAMLRSAEGVIAAVKHALRHLYGAVLQPEGCGTPKSQRRSSAGQQDNGVLPERRPKAVQVERKQRLKHRYQAQQQAVPQIMDRKNDMEPALPVHSSFPPCVSLAERHSASALRIPGTNVVQPLEYRKNRQVPVMRCSGVCTMWQPARNRSGMRWLPGSDAAGRAEASDGCRPHARRTKPAAAPARRSTPQATAEIPPASA